MLPVLSLLPLLALPAWSLDDASMRARSVYQLVTDRFALPGNGTTACDPSQMKYCGGTWQTVIDHLDYIQGMGFDTVWISPVVENINDTTAIGQAYHGYWTLNPANLNSHFGSADDLKALSKALHDRSMYLQVDVVINHVAATSSSTFQPSSAYGAFSQSSDYHPFCWIQDYTNQTEVEDCWLGDSNVALADLNSESDTVQNYWNGWIKQLIADYNIDAIRLDTVKHVPHASWKSFTSSFDVFNQGEVLNDDPAYIASYQKNASVNPFNYAVYYPVTFTFNSTKFSMDQLISMVDQVKGNFSDPTLLGNFLNNHDNPRFESYQTDKAMIKNAHAYPLVTDGIPYVYYGSEAGFNGGADPANREPLWTTAYNTSSDMYRFFTSLNAARAAAGAANNSFYQTQMNLTGMTANELLVAKPPLISLLSNRGSSSSSEDITIPVSQTQWAPNTAIIDAVSCNTFTTNAGGDLVVKIENGQPRVFIADAQKGKVCDPSLFKNETSVPASSKPKGGAGKVNASFGLLAVLGAAASCMLL